MENNIMQKNLLHFPTKGQTNNHLESYNDEMIKFSIPSNCKATIVIESGDSTEQSVNEKKGLNNGDLVDNNKEMILRWNSINTDRDEYTYSEIDTKNSHEINVFKVVSKIKEEYEMKLEKTKVLQKTYIEFILVSFLTIILSLIGLLVFSINGFYIIHPTIYILGIFMGLGWGATALTSIYKNRRK